MDEKPTVYLNLEIPAEKSNFANNLQKKLFLKKL